MIMCFPTPKTSKERETMQENLDNLWICIEKGEKKLCKLFKKNKEDGSNNDNQNK
jgi:hypothetical protein